MVITDFAITPDQVRLDTDVGAELRREMASQPPSAAQMRIALRAQQALADKLADALGKQIGEFAVSQGWIPASAVH